MAVSKCRIDVWEPVLGGTLVSKWMTVQTASNFNAVISTFIGDKLGNSRRADIVVSNKAKDFTAPTSGGSSTFTYHYRDSDGVNINSSGYSVPKATGVLTDIFRDFQYIRVVDEGTKQIMFLGRIINIKEEYAARHGQIVTLKCRDALYELILATNKGLSKSITFYPKGSISTSHSGHSPTDIVKSLLGMLYRKDVLNLQNTDHIKGTGETNVVITDTLATDIVYGGSYDPNIVTSDSGTNARNRFQNDAKMVSTVRKLDINQITSKGVLGEILKTLQTSPQDSQGNNETFGWDYFADPNISYGAHADFRGKNFDPATKPSPAMFNVFERGTRLANMAPLNYGLSVKYPAQIKVSTTNHKTDVTTSTTTTSTKPMSAEFEFDRPKEELYTTVILHYNAGKEEDSGGFLGFGGGKGKKETMRFEIMYVTEISGQFKHKVITGSGNEIVIEEDMAFGDGADNFVTDPTRPGVKSPEYLNLYQSDGTTAVSGGAKIARIQYQSHTSLSGAANFGYIIITEGDDTDGYGLFTSLAAGTYVLKGVGDGDGANASNATCKINLGASLARQGFPRRVWGLEKVKTISRSSEINLESIRQEVADTLHRSSAEIVNGNFTMSGPPLYYWDGVVRSISSVTGGQAITVKNVNGTNAVNLVDFGFREGMLMSHMIAGYGRMVTTAVSVNGSNVQKDVFGYCFDVNSDNVTYSVNLTESQDFEVGDPIRITVPLRAGDSIRVENILSDIAGNFMITDISFTEEPNQMTKLNVTGVNQGFGFTVSPFQASIADLRQESADILSLPKGHQVATWTGLFSAVDFNTIQWQTVNGKATVELQDGTIYNIDASTTNDNNTTHASGTDGEGTRFGIANAAHPAVGDDTVYYIFVDANKENPLKDLSKKYHFYTRPADTPDSGSDSVYKQDGDNVIVGWMKAGATSGDTAEFGVYRDSKPGEGKRNLPSMVHTASATSALLKKGAQTFTTDLQIQASAYPNDLARRHVKWHGGEATADTTHANIKMADGDNRVIAYGGDTGDDGTGVNYAYTTNGSSYSNISAFSDNTTYYAFIDFVEDPTGNMTLRWTNSYSIPYGDDRVLLCMIVVPPDNTKGRSPLIFPFTTKSLSINASVIAANSITADHIQANTIDVNNLRIGTSSGAIAGLTTAGTLNLTYIGSGNMDNIGDGSIHGKLRLNNLNGGNLDFSSGSIANKNLDNLPDGSTYGRLRGRDLNNGDIDFDNANYLNKNLNYISDGSTYKRTTANQRDGGGRGYAGLNLNNRVAQNIVAAATSSGENITAYFYGGSSDSPNNLLLINAAGMASYAGVSGTYPNFSLPTPPSGYATFQILTSNGQAQFGSNTVIADSTGLKVYSAASGGSLRTWLKSNSGMAVTSGYNGGLWFQNLAGGSTGTVYSYIITGSGTNSTYGHSNNADPFGLTTIFNDIRLNTTGGDIYLRPKTGGTADKEGYVKIGDRPLVFMDADDAGTTDSIHSASMDFVGFWKKSGDIGRSTVYRLPWASNDGSTPSDGQVLAIDGGVAEMDGSYAGNDVNLYGLPTNPYVYNLQWVDAGGDHNTNNIGTHTGRVTGTGLVIEAGDVYKIAGMITGSEQEVSVNSSGYMRRDSSSLVYKENPRPIEVDTSKVLTLVPRTFTWKDIDGIGEEIRGTDGFGLIAEEVHEILPELVTYDEDNNPSGVRYRMISVLLLEEIKKLKARIEVLEGN